MLTLQDRAKAFEAQLAHDQDLRFRVLIRRSRIIGHWATHLLGKTGNDAQSYIRDVIRLSLENVASEQTVIEKLVFDLGYLVAETDVRSAFARAEDEARRLVFEDRHL